MAPGSDTFRLAMGVFYESDRLNGALHDLLRQGFVPGDLCLAGMRSALPSAADLQDAGSEGIAALSALVQNVEAISHSQNDAGLIATAGSVLQVLREVVPHFGESSGGPESCPSSKVFAKLAEHAYRGATLLVVRAPIPALQDQCMRTLLKYSLHSVYAQEFKRQV